MALGRVNKTGVQYLKKGEFVLPYGVKPTKDQLSQNQKKKPKRNSVLVKRKRK